jgi:CDP-ribitol ribitolphosphotransferase
MDFILIQQELIERNKDIEIVCICNRLGKGLGEYVRFAKDFLVSMYHLATSRVCILDSYWPPVSLLNHKDSLKVIQIWHSIGKVKKSGYQSIGKKSGRNTNIAHLLNMHENYNHVIAGAEIFNRFYCESFNIKEDILLNYGLPRIDYLINTADDNRTRFFQENPELKEKKIVLYTPTFRRNMEAKWDQIIDKVDYNKYALIIKNHPSQRIYGEKPQGDVRYFDDWKTMDLIAVCDYIITDYSAIALEAAVLNKRTYYWAYDYKEYLENNGLNINLHEAAPGHVFKEIDELMQHIENGEYDDAVLDAYRRKYLPENLGTSTEKITDLIVSAMTEGKN